MALITAITGVANITAVTNGAAIELSVAAPGAGGGVAIAASNSTYTSGTVVISGSNNLTASYNAGTILLSVPSAIAQTNQTIGGFAASQSTAQSSSTTFDARSMSLAGKGAVSVGFSAGSIVLSAPVQSAQTFVSGIAGSNTTYTSGVISITGVGGGVTVSSNTGQRVDISVAAPVAQSSVTFSNANGVSFGLAGSTVTASIAAGATATGNLGGIAMNAATTYTSGTVVLSAGNNITLGSAGQTITISGVASAPAQTNQSLGIYASSQTYGASSSSTYDARSLTIVGQGGISAGWTNGSLALSGPTAVAAAMNIAASNTTYTSGTVSFTGVGGGVTVSSNTGQRVDISVAAPVAQTNQSMGWYALSQTTGGASSTTLDARTISVNAAGQLSAGYSAGSLQISGPGLLGFFLHNSAAMYSFVASGQTNASASVIHIHIPEAMTFTRVDVPVSIQTASSATAATAAFAISSVAVLYSRNASTLNPIVGVSGTQTVSWVSNTGIASSATGPRLASFNLATSLTAGDYWLGLHMSTTSGISTGAATTALNATVSMILGAFVASMTGTGWGDINGATNQTLNAWFPFQGVISSAITATGQTLQMSQITHTGTALVRANPMVLLRSAL